MHNITPRRRIREISGKTTPPRIYSAHLAEDYDGIGQYVLVGLSKGSTSTAYRARVGAGDFGTGQVIPAGTPVSVYVGRGRIEILTLGAK